MQSGVSGTRTRAEAPAGTNGANGYAAGADIVGILDTLDLPIVVVGTDCKVSRFNQAAIEMFGVESSDIGRLPSNIRRLSEVKEIEKLSMQVMAHGAACQSEIRDGDRWFVLRAAPYMGSSGEIDGVVLTFTNVTAFRASIAQAVYEREYTKTILNAVTQPLIVLDADLRVQTGNRAFYAMFGVSREATRGTPLCDLGNHDWRALTLWESLKASFLVKSEFGTREVEADFPVIGRRTVLFDACWVGQNGNAMILVGLRDITERKQQQDKLENMVAERTATLRETVGELEAFSYSIAHDMRAPLRGMQGFARILVEEHAGQLDAKALDCLQRIISSACRLDRLIQDVLNYSKIIKMQIQIEPLDLDRLTRDIIEAYPGWQPPKAELQVEGALPKVLGNEAFLTQCISNLLSNAIKFVSPGTVPRVRIWAEEVTALSGGDDPKQSPPDVRLYFEDNGLGIAPEKHDRIFRMFERIYPATEYEGTGIGLTIARRAAERMGGSVGFKSQLGKGSKFWIQLKKS